MEKPDKTPEPGESEATNPELEDTREFTEEELAELGLMMGLIERRKTGRVIDYP